MLKIGVDFDDVLAPFNERAIEIANEYQYPDHNSLPLKITDLNNWDRGWELLRDVYYNPELYKRQYVPDEAKEFMAKLQKKGDVYILTAVMPEYMGERIRQIREAFPDFPEENIVMGQAKHLVHVDVLLDDSPVNIRNSNANFPVLFRQPWNHEVTGILAVNNYDEFLQLLEQIKKSMVEDRVDVTRPAVIALVGPSGSYKTWISKKLCGIECAKMPESGWFHIPKSYTTKPGNDGTTTRQHITDTQFRKMDFLEKTMYGGYAYGTTREDIQEVIDAGKFAVMAMDMCGAVAMKQYFPTAIIYCKRSKEHMVETILGNMLHLTNSNIRENTLRIISIESEMKNENLCDFTVDSEDVTKAAREIIKICGKYV